MTLLLFARPAAAGSGFRVMLPGWPLKGNVAPRASFSAPTTPQAGNPTGLVVTLDTSWVEGNGYRPVRVTVVPTAPTNADRTLHVTFRPGYFRNPAISVSRQIDLPAGFTSVTTTLSLPQFENWNNFVFDVFEDGAYVKELSIPQNYMGVGSGQYWGDNASPAILLLSAGLSNSFIANALSRSGQPVLEVGPSNVTSTSTIFLQGNPTKSATISLSNTIPTLADLPDRWIDYSALDVIIATRQDLKTLVGKHKRQWNAIRLWTLAGGNLWVCGAGDIKQIQWTLWDPKTDRPWTHLDEINRIIDFPAPQDTSHWSEVPALAGWAPPDVSKSSVFSNQYTSGPQDYSLTEKTIRGASRFKEPKFPFAMRPLGTGMVVAFPEGNPTNNGAFPWQMVFANIGDERWAWPARHGVSFNSPNANFWNFLIPDVGAAPVTAFQVLITLFVLVIGPLNFYVLRRWHKLNLLLITVPASAALVTAALFLYAIFSDGFGVRARTRSFTALNQQTGEATCFGRITYYAGLTPSKGLVFPGDVAVFPLTDTPIANYDSGITRRLAWQFDGPQDEVGTQSLESGWLQSRIQTQLVTVRSRKSDARLGFSKSGDGSTTVKNQLGTHVSFVIARDEAGYYSTASDLAPDAAADLAPVADAEPIPQIALLRREYDLSPPQGLQTGGSQAIFHIRRRYSYRSPGTMQYSGLENYSLLERSLRDSIDEATLRKMPPRSYLAVVERSPEFELGLAEASDESSLHVIYGRW